MMSGTKKYVALTKSDIAELAGVGRSTVSNWIRRHRDFPAPVENDPRELFDGAAIRKWLKDNGKRVRELAPGVALFNVMNQLRGAYEVEELTRYISAMLVWRFVSDPESPGFDKKTPKPDQWLALVSLPSAETQKDRLIQGMSAYEKRHSNLAGIFAPFIDSEEQGAAPKGSEDALSRIVAVLDEISSDEIAGAFDEFRLRVDASNRWGRFGEHTSSDFLSELLAEVARNIPGPVHDPAAGGARSLIRTALIGGDRTAQTGQEINPEARAEGLQRAVINGFDAIDIRLGDTFGLPDPWGGHEAQVVVVDPPYSMAVRDVGSLALHPRLPYGPPAKSRGDVAWLQLAISFLGTGGRAFVIQTPMTTYAGGPTKRVREGMLRDNTVEAVVSLPRGLASTTTIPLTLWVLARPGEASLDGQVLMVDFTEYPIKSLNAGDIGRLLDGWRDRREVPQDTPAVAVKTADILADDGDLTPTRWIPRKDIPTADDITEYLTQASGHLKELQGLHLIDKTDLLAESRQLRMESITELESLKVLQILSVRRPISRDQITDSGKPLVTVKWLRGHQSEKYVAASDIDDGFLQTRPGDVVVGTLGSLEARADHEGGLLVGSSGFILLRPDPTKLDADFLAEAVVTRANWAMAQGTGAQRVRPQDLKIPILSIAEQRDAAAKLKQIRQLSHTAESLVKSLGHLRGNLVEALTAGEVRFAPDDK